MLAYSGRLLWQVDPKLFLLAAFLNSVSSFVILPNLLLDKQFFDILVANAGKPDVASVLPTVYLIVAARFGLAAVRSLSNRLSGYVIRHFFWKMYQKTEVLIGTKYATISVPTLEDPQFKDRYQKIERESLNRLQRVAENFVRIPQHLTGIASSLSIFIITQPIVAVISLLSLLPSVIVDRIFIKKGYELETQTSSLHRFRGFYYYLLGRTRSNLESRLLNVHDYLGKKIHFYWQQIIDKRSNLEKRRRAGDWLAGVLDDAVSYSFDAVFAIQALLGQITIGTLQAYIRAISSFKTSVSSLTVNMMELYENYLYITDLNWFLNLEEPYFNDQGQPLPEKIFQGIEFKDVWFKYPGTDAWILKGISFTILPHENVAIVGKNGAGKTTLVKLLCGFYAPTKGSISIDGIDIASLNKPDYWGRISVLFQEFEGYSITARESIAISKISQVGNDAEIKKYADLTGIGEWIENLPLKYDNPLNRDFEKGTSPSSGQWQKIAIARALFKQPELLVLDEPTSNVDPEAEEEIFNKILDLSRDSIILFISHRFSTVRRADKIVLVDGGKVAESGSHSQLMKLKGKYSKLFTLQAKSYR